MWSPNILIVLQILNWDQQSPPKVQPLRMIQTKLLMHEIQVCSLGFRVIGFRVLIIVCQSNQTEHDGWGSREVVSSRYEGSSSSRYPILELLPKTIIFSMVRFESRSKAPQVNHCYTPSKDFSVKNLWAVKCEEKIQIYIIIIIY